jgi:hypothetical protein
VDNTKQQMLRRAVRDVGRTQLADALGVPPPLLDAWVEGKASMPDGKLVLLSGILERRSPT